MTLRHNRRILEDAYYALGPCLLGNYSDEMNYAICKVRVLMEQEFNKFDILHSEAAFYGQEKEVLDYINEVGKEPKASQHIEFKTPLPDVNTDPRFVFIDTDTRRAIELMLEFCKGETGKSHQGYFGPGGWAYEQVNSIIESIKQKEKK